jgi:hypothetical protein
MSSLEATTDTLTDAAERQRLSTPRRAAKPMKLANLRPVTSYPIKAHIFAFEIRHTAHLLEPEEARRQAGIDFGGLERTREQCYEQRPGQLPEAALQHVRFALRWLARNPIFQKQAHVIKPHQLVDA